ncbi:cytochrome P450 4c21-like isoform X2 [Helicoverpa zea]|uniref:cytochrome P450 4c21-like isoform X2 n=1 Tax=Helicoverpa zea TaxID=7113 RepID=UPI001F5A29AD|nr:cytochrome P450 4c21-like isoform X2 [Helicoverpa zea]
MVLGVLIVACCVLFAVWRLVKPRSPSPTVDPEKLGADSSLSCITSAIWSWLKPRSVKSPTMYPGCLPLIGHGYQLIGDDKHLWKREKEFYDFCLQNNDLIEVRVGTHSMFINRWKIHRKLLNPAFNLNVLQSFVGEFNRQAKLLVSSLASEAGKGPFDIRPYLITNELKSAYRTAFGTKVENSETLTTYSHATEKILTLILERMQNIWLHLSFIYKMTKSSRESDKLAKIMKDITESVINNRKSQLKAAKQFDKVGDSATEDFVPLLDRMLDLADKQNAFTDDDIREHLDTIVGAAYDTTATAVTFILVVIGSHPDVQEKMYQELQKVLDDEERDINKHDLPKLVYMEAVIKETLRLYSPAPRFARTSNTDVKLKNYTLPANSTYIISVYGLHRHAMWGPDKDQFIPERWLDPARLPKNPNFFAAFSLGRRNCIGRLYGVMAIKTTLSYILRHFRVFSDIEKLETGCDVLLKPVAGHFISLESRV